MKSNFDAYLRYEELTRAMHALAEEHPGLCKVESIGKSYEGREIWLAELTTLKTGPATTKPAFWVDGNTHAGEVTGSMAALYLVEHLLENHGSEEPAPPPPPHHPPFPPPPPPLPCRRRTLPHDSPSPEGHHPPLARAGRGARPPTR